MKNSSDLTEFILNLTPITTPAWLFDLQNFLLISLGLHVAASLITLFPPGPHTQNSTHKKYHIDANWASCQKWLLIFDQPLSYLFPSYSITECLKRRVMSFAIFSNLGIPRDTTLTYSENLQPAKVKLPSFKESSIWKSRSNNLIAGMFFSLDQDHQQDKFLIILNKILYCLTQNWFSLLSQK